MRRSKALNIWCKHCENYIPRKDAELHHRIHTERSEQLTQNTLNDVSETEHMDCVDAVQQSLLDSQLLEKERMKNLEGLLELASTKGLSLANHVPYDGNCFFHSVCHLKKLSSSALKLRYDVLQYLKSDEPSSTLKDILTLDVFTDLESSSKDIQDGRVIKGTAELLGIQIRVVTYTPDNPHLQLNTYNPKSVTSHENITLGHIDKKHYVPLKQGVRNLNAAQGLDQETTITNNQAEYSNNQIMDVAEKVMSTVNNITSQIKAKKLSWVEGQECLMQCMEKMDTQKCNEAERVIRKRVITYIMKCIDDCESLVKDGSCNLDQLGDAKNHENKKRSHCEEMDNQDVPSIEITHGKKTRTSDKRDGNSEQYCDISSHTDDEEKALNEEYIGEDGEVWTDDEDLAELNGIYKREKTEQNKTNLVMSAFIQFILIWQNFSNVSTMAMIILLKGIKIFLGLSGKVFMSAIMLKLASAIPDSWYKVKQCIGLNPDDFTRYVICTKCNSLYEMREATVVNGAGVTVSARCSHIPFRNHAQKKYREKCNTKLMRTVYGIDGKSYLYPNKTFCYKSVRHQVEDILKRPGVKQMCELEHEDNGDILMDIQDGNVWKDTFFQDKTKLNIGLSANIDWFQPYKHSQYSLGCIYAVLNNLPRHIRYKEENMILVGILPGPSEPKLQMNSFLEPFVDELLKLYNGFEVKNVDGIFQYRCKLLCLAADVPACRKSCGFVGHSAAMGCSKCTQIFQKDFGEKADYSKMENAPARNSSSHRTFAHKWRVAKNRAEQIAIERSEGVRYSEFLRLPYWDPVTQHIIDPMHNLLLGSAKHIIKTWIDLEILTPDKMSRIQEYIDNVNAPSDIGRIPRKIATGFSGFTADEWKNFVCYYSLCSLKPELDPADYKIWTKFAHACMLLCSKVIHKKSISLAHDLLLSFVEDFSRRYGWEKSTINMHLHKHVKQCILDFGPVYSFWCFSFERYNGLLGKYHTNNHSIEVQVMRKFVQNNQIQAMNKPYADNFKHIIPEETQKGTLKSVNVRNSMVHECDDQEVWESDYSGTDDMILTKPEKKYVLSDEEIHHLKNMFKVLHPTKLVHSVPVFAKSVKKVMMNGESISSNKTRAHRSSNILAKWLGMSEEGFYTIDANAEARAAIVQNILICKVILQNLVTKAVEQKEYVVLMVSWYRTHPSIGHFPPPLSVYCTGALENPDEVLFMPLKRVISTCLETTQTVKFLTGQEEVKILVPLNYDSETLAKMITN